jgi:hypothetical protein
MAGPWDPPAAGQPQSLVVPPQLDDTASPVDLILEAGAPYALATGAHRKPGDVVITIPAPTNGGTVEGLVRVKRLGVALDLLRARYNPGPIIPGAIAGLEVIDPNTGGVAIGLWNDLYLNGGVRVRLAVGTGYPVASALATGFFFEWATAIDSSSMAGGGNGVVGIYKATTNPNGSAGGGNAGVLFADATTVALKYRAPGTGGQLQTTTAAAASGTPNTQALLDDCLVQVGRIIATGGTLTLDCPLPTSLTNCQLDVTALAKIAIAGSVNAAGDTYSYRETSTFKNLAGLCSRVGASQVLCNNADASLNTSALTYAIIGGTTIRVTLTLNATAGTLGTADATIRVRQLAN